jgi:serine phosphatase RsbU (regulator of sigma subunit)
VTAPGGDGLDRGDLDRESSVSRSHAKKRRRGRSAATMAMLVLVVGFAITGVLAWVTATVNDRNENRLLQEQVDEAGTVVSGVLQTIGTPLASGAAIAGVTGGRFTPFSQFIAPYVGRGGPFAYVALCGVENGAPAVLGSVGSPSGAARKQGAAQCDFISQPHPSSGLSVGRILGAGSRVSLSYVSPGTGPPMGVYAEYVLPPHRHIALPQSSSFPNLSFALYLGRQEQESNLVEATTYQLPIEGRHTTTTIPFANIELTLVGTPTQPLGGSLSRRVTPVVILVGVILAIGAAVMTERLVRRRRSAEALAEENERLYGEQQTVAVSLQHALLPGLMPEIAGVEIATRYEAGIDVMEIGGDWFDVIPSPDEGFVFVVGDVSGRGVHAAVVMASLHFAIRAYAAQGDAPSEILTKLCALLDIGRDGHFATVLCGHVDKDRRRLALSSAGHLPPLLVSNGKGTFVDVAIGPPIGTVSDATYASTSIDVPAGSTLLAFTDGLVERRGEIVDVGLESLRQSAIRTDRPLDRVLSDVIDELTSNGSDDDIAILGLRWKI